MSASADISEAGRKLALQGIRQKAKTAKLRSKLPEDKLQEIRAALGLVADDDEEQDETQAAEEG